MHCYAAASITFHIIRKLLICDNTFDIERQVKTRLTVRMTKMSASAVATIPKSVHELPKISSITLFERLKEFVISKESRLLIVEPLLLGTGPPNLNNAANRDHIIMTIRIPLRPNRKKLELWGALKSMQPLVYAVLEELQYYDVVLVHREDESVSNSILSILSEFPRPLSLRLLEDGFESFRKKFPFFCRNANKPWPPHVNSVLGERERLYSIVKQGTCDEPSEVLDRLYISSRVFASDKRQLASYGITHIVNVSECDECYPEKFEYLSFPEVEDNKNQDLTDVFIISAAFIDAALISPRARVLIHCVAGVSRSAAIALGYMMHKGQRLVDAYEQLHAARPLIMPNVGFLKQLFQLEQRLFKDERTMSYVHVAEWYEYLTLKYL